MVDNDNIIQLTQPAVDRESFGDVFLGLVKTAGNKAIEKEFAEKNPPTATTTNNIDTARGELQANSQKFVKDNAVLIGASVLIAGITIWMLARGT